MKAFGVTLIVLALMAATFSDDVGWVHMSKGDSSSWGIVATLAIVYAAYWFSGHDE